MSKNKQKANRRPPLSVLDKAIYVGIFVFLTALLILLLFISYIAMDAIALKDRTVVAYRNNGCEFFMLPLFINILLSGIALYFATRGKKLPIFGNKDIRYGEYPWAKDCYPIFGKQSKHLRQTPRESDVKKALFGLWIAVFIITLLMYPLGLFGRACLHTDNSITAYDILNRKSETVYTVSDYSAVKFIASHGGHRDPYDLDVIIDMSDGRSFGFEYEDFGGYKNTDAWLDKLEELKTTVPKSAISYEETHRLERTADYFSLNEEQTARLFEIFEYVP